MSQPPDQDQGWRRSWPDLAGRLVEETGSRRHVLPIRVYFEDTDFSGLVYHATYLRWCERGRSDFLRLMGNDHQALIAGVDALHTRATFSDAEFAALSAHYDEAQILEIMLLCGFYRTVSYLANGLRLPLEENAVRFPA